MTYVLQALVRLPLLNIIAVRIPQDLHRQVFSAVNLPVNPCAI